MLNPMPQTQDAEVWLEIASATQGLKAAGSLGDLIEVGELLKSEEEELRNQTSRGLDFPLGVTLSSKR